VPGAYPENIQPQLSNEKIVLRKMLFYAAGMEAVAEHSLVDAQVSNLITRMLGANPRPAIAMYETLNGAKAEARALKTIGSETLAPQNYDLLQDIMKACKTSSDYRDALAHRLWMADDQLEDSVVLVNPRSLWRMSSKVNAINAAGPATIDGVRDVQVDLRNACQIWTLTDFDIAKRAASKAFIALIAFDELLSTEGAADIAAKRAQIEAHLSS